ncbi:Sulfotransferase domain protein [Pseudobythopirellula maris]|uniref:Sulfotransferase domain protein n=2 Tax=Pseudobythopirellula maris TaxID=2527991 RepID=A0A5C5ZR80_9BACT|nr:Sulfotransferase domain protein [Pseudobythopirellula maris]
MKSGTTTLHELLATHPDVVMSGDKEPAFFTEDRSAAETERYRALFEPYGGERVVGESSTHYTKLPTHEGVPERLGRACPEARFVYMMRDPVERAISHYWHQYRSKQPGGGERRPMREAFERDERYTAYGDYARQLRPYFEAFGRESVLILTLDEFSAEPLATYQAVLGWLGVDPDHTPPGLGERRNATATQTARKRRWLARLRRSPLWEAVRGGVPAPVRRFGARLSEHRAIDTKTYPTEEARAYLRPIVNRQLDDLESLLGHDFSCWRSGGDDA